MSEATDNCRFIYKDPNQPIEARVNDLLSHMSLKEKVGQMTCTENPAASPSTIKDLSIGALYFCPASCYPTKPASAINWADMVDSLQKAALESRLGIPIIQIDKNLVDRIASATALELRATGTNFSVAPCVAVMRDPRWGRCYESFSEDSEIVSAMTSAVVGYQGIPPEGHPNGYPYVAGCWNGTRMHGHRFLLTDILKEKLGFKGFLLSDWEGIDTICEPYRADYRHCVLTSINAGLDMNMEPLRYEEYFETLISLIESGEIPMSRIDDAVKRILKVKFIAGLFEHPFADRSLLDMVGCKVHRELAREAVRKSLILLKNGKDPEKPFLPLDKNARRILVIGRHADDLGYQCGGWTITKYGTSGRITIGTTILEGIKEAVGEHSEVIYEQNPSSATFEGLEFSYAIVVVGEPAYAEGRGYNVELKIPFDGADVINMVAERVPTLVVLISGRPLVLEPELLEKMDALVAAWLPGSQGEGVADVVFGDYEFQGKLPVTWFKRVDQLPMNYGDENYDPLFPLGFGLKTKVH
nr:periplasmic beta-glucosidase [Quercus suber]